MENEDMMAWSLKFRWKKWRQFCSLAELTMMWQEARLIIMPEANKAQKRYYD